MPDRQTLRQRLRAARRALPDAERADREARLAWQILHSRAFRVANRVACYLACDGEPALDIVIERAWRLGKQCYLPVLNTFGHNRLWFAPFDPDTTLVANCFGIPEPEVAARHWLRPQQLGLVLAPLVGFDKHGNRLGMGGGYYDRSFGFLRHRRHWRQPRLAGVAFDFQQLEQLPAARWDVPLSRVFTDRAELILQTTKRQPMAAVSQD